jgi:hypothetical protein
LAAVPKAMGLAGCPKLPSSQTVAPKNTKKIYINLLIIYYFKRIYFYFLLSKTLDIFVIVESLLTNAYGLKSKDLVHFINQNAIDTPFSDFLFYFNFLLYSFSRFSFVLASFIK